MADINQLPPVYRIPPARPGSGAGQSNQAPRRKPDTDAGHPQERRQRREDDDDDAHIDEYA